MKQVKKGLGILTSVSMLVTLTGSLVSPVLAQEDGITEDEIIENEEVTTVPEETTDATETTEEVKEEPVETLTETSEESTEDATTTDEEEDSNVLKEGVNITKEGATNQTFDIGDGQVLMISGQDDPIVFDNCTFNLSGGTVKISGNQQGISYNNGETVTKLWIGGNVTFNNCTFVTQAGATKTTSAGYDAAIYFFGGDINLNGCTLSAKGYNGQFLGLYGSNGAVTFNQSNISTEGNKNGWSYAMYGGSVLKLLNGSSMTATGMTTDSGNINAFYSGDNRTGYDAIFVEDSTIDFSNNAAGGFAINNVNIHVKNSDITVNNNLGNGCNSGYWIVDNSTIQMNGNRGGHALSCIGFEMSNSALQILHNGYAGVYIQSQDSSLVNSTVDIRCNGEKLLSYSAGDLWLNGHGLTVTDCTSLAMPGSAWLGGIGRKGTITTPSGSIVAHDLSEHAVDNLKSNTSPVLTDANVVDTTKHTLFLNPFMESDYARGNAENTASNNDADLFDDQNVNDKTDIIGKDNAKIGELTEAQLSHHIYDWTNGEITDQATKDTYGIKRYRCTQCNEYVGNTQEHPNSFDCPETYVYAPLVGLTFDANTEDAVENMPTDQLSIDYNTTAQNPENEPTRNGYTFTGWYTDKECTEAFDFEQALTENWTTVYAGWEQNEYTVTVNYYDIDTNKSIHYSNILTELTWNEEYDVSRFDAIDIDGYTYVETRGDTVTGTIDGNKVIDVYYKKAQTPSKPEKEDSDNTDSADTATQTNVGLMVSSMIAAGSALCLLIIKRFYKKR
ncbi:InlB B-repeat-containing protein [Faecalicoccus pleomorphus]|uniref:InlB B-repeat-containing protein n=1 Tax=Faecalicoccus pleomorphus TaxID=1323 RepID=UPI0039F4B098